MGIPVDISSPSCGQGLGGRWTPDPSGDLEFLPIANSRASLRVRRRRHIR
jgi:hypothetical protein